MAQLFTSLITPKRWAVISALGITLGIALAAPLSLASAQGRCGGARAATPACDTTPYKAPFAPTGWKTVGLDHFSVSAVDYKAEAAYYQTLMDWKVLSDDGKQAVLQLGNIGHVVIKGGFVPPPPGPPRGGGAGGAGGPPAGAAAGDTTGRGRAGGGAGRAGGGAPRVNNQAWDGFCWTISPWDVKKVEAELTKRGLNPVADNDGDFMSFHVKDPDGFDVQIGNGKNHKSWTSAKPEVKAPFEPTGWKTLWLDHISFSVSNYKESSAWYAALLGWKPTGDEGSQNEAQIGEVGNAIIRGGNPAALPAGSPSAPRRAVINHVSFGLANFEPDPVLAELTKRGLNGSPDTGGKGDIHDPAAKYKSYHTTTPQGFDLQISNASKANRTVR